ncbi:MAG: hypothetical protein FWC36_07625, partial [Spirochaetes bacterium]|nr:hypothetical protein [Spirochaetota bacterium]
KNGGRIEKRTAYTTTDIEWIYNLENWKDLSCIGAIHREFEKMVHLQLLCLTCLNETSLTLNILPIS